MAAPPIPSALDPRTQIFPTLTPSQIDRIRPQGNVRHVDRGEILFDVGDTNIPFFVILSGSMEVVQPGLDQGGIFGNGCGSRMRRKIKKCSA